MTTTSTTRDEAQIWTVRFRAIDRWMHAILFTTFLGLSLTGIPLLFSDEPWAPDMARLFGGYGVTGTLHRLFAALMLGTFVAHLARVGARLVATRDWGILWGPRSLVPRPKDFVDLYQHVRWFLGRGPRPQFDRYTYWEKFDYWAVFWGMGIIGVSGLMLWFSAFFARFLPGWMFNVAHVVHGEEALLAMVFIFTVHFFNGNLRPEKFPMDDVMFTGRVSLKEIREERPAEYERILRENLLDEIETTAPPRHVVRFGRTVGTIAIVVGLVMVTLTIFALLT